MKLSTVAISMVAALSLTAGCKKKAADKAPPPTVGTAGSGTAGSGSAGAGTGTATPVAKPLEGEALAKHYLAAWDAWNAGDKAAFRAAYANDAISHWPDNPMQSERRGGDAIVEDAFGFRAGFPDAKASAKVVLVNGRTIAAVWLTTGTNTGTMKSPMGDMPPTGKKVGQLLFHQVTFDDANRVADEWYIMDSNTLMNQLGVSPQPGRPVMEASADAPMIVVSTGNDAEKANLNVAQKGNEDFNKHDLAALVAGWADDAIESDQAAPADVVGKDKIGEGTKLFIGAFSDGKVAPLSLWAAGDYIVSIATFAGTNDGDMGPMKKTGKTVKMTVAEITKLEGGKVKQLWRFFDSGSMAMQMGLMAPPSGPPAPGGAAPAKTN